MKKTRLSHPVKALALAFGLFSSAVFAADAPLKIGTTAAFAIPLEAAVAEAGKQGLKVELVEFTDWIAPNVSLAAGDIDSVFLTGGSVKLAHVRNTIAKAVPSARIVEGDIFGAVGKGLTLEALRRYGPRD